MNNNDKRLAIFSDLEYFAFYGFPDFDDEQRLQYFSFDEKEWNVILKCRSLHARVYCALQIGYFKAKNTFFSFSLNRAEVRADVKFLLTTCFKNKALQKFDLTKHEIYTQRQVICHLFDYYFWTNEMSAELSQRAKKSVTRDIAPNFIVYELLTFLKNEKIIRPGYTTLQKIIGKTLTKERERLRIQLIRNLTEADTQELNRLLKTENTLSELAALKQDAKNFDSHVMENERKKHKALRPIYEVAKKVLPKLEISQQNIDHYASLANYYTVYEFERFEEEQRYLYLLCYAFKRYQQITDTLIDALDFNVKKLEDEIKGRAKEQLAYDHLKVDKQVGRLILIYVDDDLNEDLTLKELRQMAYEILPKNSIQIVGEKLVNKTKRDQELQWKERDKASRRYSHHLRPLLEMIEFDSRLTNNSLLAAIQWMKKVFKKGESLSQQAFSEFSQTIISKRLRPYLITKNKEGEEIIDPRRYEILVYRQIIKQIQTGALHVESSTKHKTFYHELNQFEKKEDVLKTLNIPWLKKPCKEQIPLLLEELNALWIEVNDKLNKDDLKHIKYDKDNNKIVWVNPKIINEEKEERQTLYNKIPICDVADMLRFVNKETGFFSSFTPLQPRCKKQKIDEDNIIAVLISQATNVGNYKMAQTSDISYRTLETTYQQYMRLATLRKANDTIANAISRLPIFPYYLFDLDLLYGSLDGQKYDMLTPTVKARHSKKNFTKGRGVSAYTLLSNHVPINCELIGSEHESYFVFDFWYNNTSLIKPTILTSDMHGINQANFALLHWFGAEFRPRFTNLKTAIKNTCCGSDLAYGDFLVAPEEMINEQLIYDEEENINNIVKSLALKDLNQSTLIKKLCLLPTKNKTRQAVAEFDALVRSIYTLKCILHPEILVNVHRSQNRIESYHNLRAAIARIGGTKALLGQTDLEAEISNQSNRLITTAIIYYNSVILSCLLDKNIPLNKKKKLLKIIKKSSPVAWQHFHFTGHFLFYSNKKIISIKDIIESLEF